MGQDASDYFSFFPDTQVLFARKLGLYQGNVSGHMVGTLVEPESLGVVGQLVDSCGDCGLSAHPGHAGFRGFPSEA